MAMCGLERVLRRRSGEAEIGPSEMCTLCYWDLDRVEEERLW